MSRFLFVASGLAVVAWAIAFVDQWPAIAAALGRLDPFTVFWIGGPTALGGAWLTTGRSPFWLLANFFDFAEAARVQLCASALVFGRHVAANFRATLTQVRRERAEVSRG